MRVILDAPAKVNLYLGVHAELDVRGYHRVDSVMVPVGLTDIVTVEELDEERVQGVDSADLPLFSCKPSVRCPKRSNTAWRAARLMGEAFGRVPAVSVTVEKHIPSQSGLGGASADAAAVILGLCRLWDIDCDDSRVDGVARKVGADVPFFLYGGVALLRGAGDKLAEQYPSLGELPVVLVRPKGPGISTPIAYAEFDRDPVPVVPLEPMLEALAVGNVDAVIGLLANNLDPVARRLKPELSKVHEMLVAQPGVRCVMVSGSGSCTFALFEDDCAADEARNAALARGWWSEGRHVRAEGARILTTGGEICRSWTTGAE